MIPSEAARMEPGGIVIEPREQLIVMGILRVTAVTC